METLSVKYICKLSALVTLLSVAFIYKVPSKGGLAGSGRNAPVYTKVTTPLQDTHQANQLYQLVIPSKQDHTIVML